MNKRIQREPYTSRYSGSISKRIVDPMPYIDARKQEGPEKTKETRNPLAERRKKKNPEEYQVARGLQATNCPPPYWGVHVCRGHHQPEPLIGKTVRHLDR